MLASAEPKGRMRSAKEMVVSSSQNLNAVARVGSLPSFNVMPRMH